MFYQLKDISVTKDYGSSALGFGSIKNLADVKEVLFMLKVEGFDDINVAALPLVRMEESSHVHHSTPEMCLRAHGFFDVE